MLDDVPGLGPTRRKALLTRFGSVRALRAADAEEIAQVPGIGARDRGRRGRGTGWGEASGRGAASADPPGPSTRRPASCSTADRAGVISLCEDGMLLRNLHPPCPTRQRADAEVLIITGLSGAAGHSTVSNVLEDDGWFVVDNLPPQMLPPLAELTIRAAGAVRRLAVVVDVRGRHVLQPDLRDSLDDVAAPRRADPGRAVPRRRGPGAGPPLRVGPPAAPAAAARHGSSTPSARAARCWSPCARWRTSSRHQRHQRPPARARRCGPSRRSADRSDLHLTVLSFGFKHGVPVDAENVVDVRFLPNPHWVPEPAAAHRPDDDGRRLRLR